MKRIALGILAHVDSGKTTLSEASLYNAGEIRTLGRVDRRDAFLDTNEIERYGDILELKIGAETATFNGKELVLDSPAQIQEGGTMVPLRFIAETLGVAVSWDNARRMVIINK